MNLDAHLTALRRDGFTVIPDRLAAAEVAELRAITLAVRDEFRHRLESGELSPADVKLGEHYDINYQHVGIR